MKENAIRVTEFVPIWSDGEIVGATSPSDTLLDPDTIFLIRRVPVRLPKEPMKFASCILVTPTSTIAKTVFIYSWDAPKEILARIMKADQRRIRLESTYHTDTEIEERAQAALDE